MKSLKPIITLSVCTLLMVPGISMSSPEGDLKEFRAYFKKRFPDVPFHDYKNGIYALNQSRREMWETMEDFQPAYMDAVNLGKKLFETPFANGKTYSSCFKNNGIAIKQYYPYFDARSEKIKTLEMEINECREKNGEKPLKYKKGKLAAISAYMAYTSRGNKINVIVPNSPKALQLYDKGKTFFYAKRGQLNFSCADCHVYSSGMMARSELLSPALGQVTHFPVWRLKWEAATDPGVTAGLGTIQRRYGGCNKNIRAKPFKAQSEQYTTLEFFHTYMSNGLELNGPAIRQ